MTLWIASVISLVAAVVGPSPTDPRAHDPCIIRQGDWYYVYMTRGLVTSLRSHDLIHWENLPNVFSKMPDWITADLPNARGLWAPDISYFNGRYRLYYVASNFGSNRSVIGLATNETLDPADAKFKWIDEGKVIETTKTDDWNAIDPNVIQDDQKHQWLTLGSWWSGIKLYELDPATGKLAAGEHHQYTIARRKPEEGIEAPFIFMHDGAYYLFVSWDHCCRGVKSDYNIRVGRSKAVTGPYLDRDGKDMAQGGGTLVLAGSGNIYGPGHCAVLHDGDRDLLVHHFYDGTDNGRSKLQVRPLTWDAAGWPVAGEPFDPPSTQPVR